MFSIIRRTVPLLNSSLTNVKSTNQISLFTHHLAIDGASRITSSLCDSLRKGMNWDTLSKTYDPSNINDRIIKSVLLELKQPLEAKKALSFFHWVAHNKKITHGLEVYCMTIHILALARLLNDARALLESILKANEETTRFMVVDMLLSTYKVTNASPFVFDLLVQTYSKLRMYEKAFDVCSYLDEHGFSLSLATFNNLIHFTHKSSHGSGFIWKVYEHLILKGINPNEVTVRIMIDALCKAGELQMFIDVIDRIHGKRCSPSVIVNTKLVYWIISEGRIQEGITSLKAMLLKKMITDTISYSMVIYAKLKSREIDSAREIYEEMLRRGFDPNSFVYTLFIEAYCEKGMVEKARNLFEEMLNIGLKPYNDTYNTLIMGCAKTGDLGNSVRFCKEMTKNGFLPSLLAFNTMVEKLCLLGNMKQANDMLTGLIEKGFSSDVTLYSYLIDGYGKERNIQEMLKLYYEMEFKSIPPGESIFTSLIRTLCECEKFEDAEKYLCIMESQNLSPTICVYEALIFGLLKHGYKERAYQLYCKVLQKGLKFSQQISSSSFSDDLVSSHI